MSTHGEGQQGGGYERTDARLGPVLGFTIGLTVFTLLTGYAMVWLFGYLDRQTPVDSQPAHPMAISAPPPGPLLQPEPYGDLIAQRERERALLEEYAWIDRESGLVRIPIERAMELTLQRGLPAREGAK